jgi:hypothetical protein
MSDIVDWIDAEAEELNDRLGDQEIRTVSANDLETRTGQPGELSEDLQEYQNPHPDEGQNSRTVAEDTARMGPFEYYEYQQERQRRIYRARAVAMLRRYFRYSIETGRLPSLLGREFFRAKVTSYTVVTFEDRVIFVHDMETCLEKLDEFSRQIIARHILQEHDLEATGRLLGCTERTVRTYVPIALDLLTEILFDVGLLAR